MVEEYEESLLTGGHVPGVRSVPDYCVYKGQKLFRDIDRPLSPDLKFGNILLLSYAHLTTALEQRWKDPATRELPSITSAVEIGLRNAREWELTADQEDVGQILIELSNAYMKGAVTSFIAMIKFFIQSVTPQFEAWQEEQGFSTSTLPTSGPNSYYDIWWKFCRDRWPSKFKKMGFCDWMDLRAVSTRISKWKLLDQFEVHCGSHAAFTSPGMVATTVIRALLVVTQLFDNEYKHSLPQKQFECAFLGWSRLCYPNSKQAGGSAVWFAKSADDCAKLGLLLRADMRQSILYKESKKAQPGAAAKPKATAGGGGKRRRGAKAEHEAAKLRHSCVEVTETLTLTIQLANNKARNKYFVEEVAVAQNAAMGEKADAPFDSNSASSGADHHTISANFAMSDPAAGLTFEGKGHKKYTDIRKSLKKLLADFNATTSAPEQADTVQGSILEDLGGQEPEEWQILLADPQLAIKFTTFIKLMKGVQTTETKVYQDMCAVMRSAGPSGNLDKILNDVFGIWEAICNKNMRTVAMVMPEKIQKLGALPAEMQGLVADLQDVKMVAHGRTRVMLELADQFKLVRENVLLQLRKITEDIGNLDVFVEAGDLWARIWTFLLATSDATVAQRLDSIKMILKPPALSLEEKHADETSSPTAPKAEGAEGALDVKVASLLNHFDGLSVMIPSVGKPKGKPQAIPFRVVSTFMRDLENHLWTEVMSKPTKGDIGYSYLALLSHQGQKGEDRTKKLGLICKTKSKIRLNFMGPITFVPKHGALLLCSNWGMDFYVEADPRADIESDFLPAWQVQIAKAPKGEKRTPEKDKTVKKEKTDRPKKKLKTAEPQDSNSQSTTAETQTSAESQTVQTVESVESQVSGPVEEDVDSEAIAPEEEGEEREESEEDSEEEEEEDGTPDLPESEDDQWQVPGGERAPTTPTGTASPQAKGKTKGKKGKKGKKGSKEPKGSNKGNTGKASKGKGGKKTAAKTKAAAKVKAASAKAKGAKAKDAAASTKPQAKEAKAEEASEEAKEAGAKRILCNWGEHTGTMPYTTRTNGFLTVQEQNYEIKWTLRFLEIPEHSGEKGMLIMRPPLEESKELQSKESSKCVEEKVQSLQKVGFAAAGCGPYPGPIL